MHSFKSHIGAIVSNDHIVLEPNFVRHFMRALHAQPDERGEAGIPHFMLGSLGAHAKVHTLLGVKPRQVLHSRENVFIQDAPAPGDSLAIITVIRDLFEQQASSNPMGFIVTEILGKKGGSFAFRCERTTAIRGGFPRRQS